LQRAAGQRGDLGSSLGARLDLFPDLPQRRVDLRAVESSFRAFIVALLLLVVLGFEFAIYQL
jgi:hypothetical protein